MDGYKLFMRSGKANKKINADLNGFCLFAFSWVNSCGFLSTLGRCHLWGCTKRHPAAVINQITLGSSADI